jgi:REP element-mobilizing transposase RayT
MGLTYTIKNQEGQYFITCTVNQWIDVFTRDLYREIVLDSIRYSQQNKGLEVYAWVLMINHIHMIVSSDKNKLSDIISLSSINISLLQNKLLFYNVTSP